MRSSPGLHRLMRMGRRGGHVDVPRRPAPGRLTRVAVAALALAHLLASAASAQLRGRVVDAGGQPVSGVAVEIWSPVRRLGVRVADDGGAFQFSREEAREVSGILARRVGWRTAHLRASPGDTLVVVRMEPQPEALEGLTVTATRTVPCPNRESPRARALWTALRDRYRGGADTSAAASYYLSVESVGPKEQVGMVDTARAQRGWLKSVEPHRRLWARLISTGGYGFEIRQSMGEAYAAWQYPPLESYYATHFVEDLFGAQHTLSIVRESADEVVLRFCPRERSGRKQRLEGTLTLAADGALRQAAWKYLTPAPREDAGGEIDFAPPPPSFRSALLLPATSLYWRRTTGGRYYQRWYRYSEWRVVGYFERPDWEDVPGGSSHRR